jgi:hypothetical protein
MSLGHYMCNWTHTGIENLEAYQVEQQLEVGILCDSCNMGLVGARNH